MVAGTGGVLGHKQQVLLLQARALPCNQEGLPLDYQGGARLLGRGPSLVTNSRCLVGMERLERPLGADGTGLNLWQALLCGSRGPPPIGRVFPDQWEQAMDEAGTGCSWMGLPWILPDSLEIPGQNGTDQSLGSP